MGSGVKGNFTANKNDGGGGGWAGRRVGEGERVIGRGGKLWKQPFQRGSTERASRDSADRRHSRGDGKSRRGLDEKGPHQRLGAAAVIKSIKRLSSSSKSLI